MQHAGPMIGLLALASVGCGSASASDRSALDARSSARTAQEVGAEQTPQAAYHLELANEELASASLLANNNEHEAAERMFERAHIDAELAIALSREAQTSARATETQRRIDTARETFVQGGSR